MKHLTPGPGEAVCPACRGEGCEHCHGGLIIVHGHIWKDLARRCVEPTRIPNASLGLLERAKREAKAWLDTASVPGQEWRNEHAFIRTFDLLTDGQRPALLFWRAMRDEMTREAAKNGNKTS